MGGELLKVGEGGRDAVRGVRNVVFDWSGTLVNDLPPVLETSNRLLEAYGAAAMGEEEFRRRFRLPWVHFYEELLPGVPIEELEVRFQELFEEAESVPELIPHAREFLEYCQGRGMRLFVLSAIPEDHFEEQAERMGLAKFFEGRYLGVRDKRHCVHEIVEGHGLEREVTMLVGDMEHDMDTARHGGLKAVATLTGYNFHAQLYSAGPDLIVENLSELRSIMSGAEKRETL
ncbi:MAG: HAD family hydrolase [Verrucomicrobiota bacterium]